MSLSTYVDHAHNAHTFEEERDAILAEVIERRATRPVRCLIEVNIGGEAEERRSAQHPIIPSRKLGTPPTTPC